MAHQSLLIEEDIIEYLHKHEHKELLRFITCGSVDDGKSTLIGRLLHDSKMIFEDQLAAITKESKKVGTTGERVDLALLVDGLQSEREQGITIDVAYRYFSTDKRKFIIADTPGHEQYTRNMATGASTADLAIILIDARYGVQTQTRRHSFICSLLGIKHIIVAINKMDLVDYSEKTFSAIQHDYQELAQSLNFNDVQYIPISALEGDNVVNSSKHLQWYRGLTLMQALESQDILESNNEASFRLPIQYVNRPHLDFRGFSGTIASGEVSVNDEVLVMPSGLKTKIKEIVTFDGNLTKAQSSQAITLVLQDEIDISRGDMLVAGESLPYCEQKFQANVVWMSEQPMHTHDDYLIKFATKLTNGHVSIINHKINVNTFAHEEAAALTLNEIGECNFSLNETVVFDLYTRNRQTGAFIIIDRITNATVGVGMIKQTLNDSTSTVNSSYSAYELELNAYIRKHFPHWQAKDISKL